MQRLVVFAVLGALAAPVRADVGVAMVVHASKHATTSDGGGGALLEVSRRRGRLAYFGDLGLSVISATNRGGGFDTQLLGGVRVIPRSFVADEVTFELAVDLFAGGELMQFSGDSVLRPMIGGGAGWQVRMNETKTILIMVRLFAAPGFSDPDAPVCRGTCPEADHAPGFGFMGVFGASW